MSETIVERLRTFAEHDVRETARDGTFEANDAELWATLMESAADEITRLKSLLVEVLGAIEPFAEAASKNAYRKDFDDDWSISYMVPITMGDLRRAREAFQKAKGETE